MEDYSFTSIKGTYMKASFSAFPDKFDDIESSVDRIKPFLIGDVDLTYGDLIDRINKTSNFFKAIGLEVGDCAVVACRDDLETAILFLAALQFGLTMAIIDPQSSATEATLLTDTIRPRAIFFEDSLLNATKLLSDTYSAEIFAIKPRDSRATRTKSGLLRIRPAVDLTADQYYPAVCDGFSANFIRNRDIPEDLTALILFTSGTTSQPKGVELTHRNLHAQFDTFIRHYGFDPDSRILNHLPLHHTDGLNQGPVIAFYACATWVHLSGNTIQNLPALLSAVMVNNVSHFITVPTIVALIEQLPPDFDNVFATPNFRFIASTAGYLDSGLWRRFEARFNVLIVNSYGLTETVSEALYCGPTTETRKIGTIGRPIDCEALVVDDKFAPVRTGETGELVIKGDNVMKGYFANHEANEAIFRDGWLLTGDLATMDEEGYFRIVGRIKNVIIRAGVNVYPEDVTNSVMQLPEVIDAVTIGVADYLMGEKVITCVTTSEYSPDLPGRVIEHCRQFLAREKVPDSIRIVDELPRGPAGKVILQELRTLIENDVNDDESAPGRELPIDAQVIQIAAGALDLPAEQLNLTASSETVKSWDSLSHLKMIMAFEQNFSIAMTPGEVMRIRSLADAAQIVREKSKVRDHL